MPTSPAGDYIVRVCDADGTIHATTYKATVERVKWTLNSWEEVSISFPVHDAALTSLVSTDATTLRWLQVWRDGAFLVWVLPIRFEANSKVCRVECVGPLWLLTRKHVGRLWDVNQLTNGDFESGLTGWTVDSGVDSAAAQTSVNAMFGSKVARLETASASINTSRIYQQISLPASSSAQDWVVTGYSWPSPYDPWVPFDPYTIGLVALVWNGSTYVGGGIKGGGLDDNEDVDFWTRKRVSVRVPPHAGTWRLDVFCMSPGGVVHWDYVRAIRVERLAFMGSDQATIARDLVRHAQDTAYGKVDLGIVDACPATGVTRSIVYPFAAHQTVFDALTELANQDDGLDFAITGNTGAMVFRTYARKGSATPTVALAWGDNISDIGWSFSPGEGASAVAVVGEGSTDEEGRADDREHVYAEDTAALGGLLLERIETQPSGPYAYVRQMEDQAAEILASSKRLVSYDLKSYRHPASDFVDMIQAGILQTGDSVSVAINHGIIQVAEVARVVAIEVDPRTEAVTFTVVP